ICALQFWKRANDDFDSAWNDYINLCRLGRTLPFNALVEAASLRSPFEYGCLESVVGEVRDYLNSIDDNTLQYTTSRRLVQAAIFCAVTGCAAFWSGNKG